MCAWCCGHGQCCGWVQVSRTGINVYVPQHNQSVFLHYGNFVSAKGIGTARSAQSQGVHAIAYTEPLTMDALSLTHIPATRAERKDAMTKVSYTFKTINGKVQSLCVSLLDCQYLRLGCILLRVPLPSTLPAVMPIPLSAVLRLMHLHCPAAIVAVCLFAESRCQRSSWTLSFSRRTSPMLSRISVSVFTRTVERRQTKRLASPTPQALPRSCRSNAMSLPVRPFGRPRRRCVLGDETGEGRSG